MKKLVFAFALTAIVGLSSCKKEETCSCTSTTAGYVAIDAKIKDTKKKREDFCSKAETTYKVADPNVKCTLK